MTAQALQSRWAQHFANGPTGLALARERNWILAWESRDRLHLLNRNGQRQGQTHLHGLTLAQVADDGSAFAAGAADGTVCWLQPDLSTRWRRTIAGPVRALALDPFGQYVAGADSRGEITLFDHQGRTVWVANSPRPLSHLAFVPAQPLLVGAADFGLIVGINMSGDIAWRDGLVVHIGDLAVNEDGSQILLACFGEGLIRYDNRGVRQEPLPFREPCRLVVSSFDGSVLLLGSLDHRISIVSSAGRVLATQRMSHAITGLALSALADEAFVSLSDGTLIAFAIAHAG